VKTHSIIDDAYTLCLVIRSGMWHSNSLVYRSTYCVARTSVQKGITIKPKVHLL